MSVAFRRAPALLARVVRTNSSVALRAPTTRVVLTGLPNGHQVYPVALRAYHDSGKRSQYASGAVVEEQIERELSEERPPSDAVIDAATAMGEIKHFHELGTNNLVHRNVVRAITEKMGLSSMTQVQSLTISETLKGTDVLAQAKTGTGKTLAFLVPVIQNIISKDPKLASPRAGRATADSLDIRALILSPTRELAEQIAREAVRVASSTGVMIQTAVGGSHKASMLRKTREEGCHILVGTPGRVKDLLEDEYSGIKAPNLSALVLDEADRMLEQGFEIELNAIRKCLPHPSEVDRQTLLFSATIPDQVIDVVERFVKPDAKFIRTVNENETPTHELVPQREVHCAGLENFMPALLELVKREKDANTKAGTPFKAIVFFNSTAEVQLAHEIFKNLRSPGSGFMSRHVLHPVEIIQIHSKLSQNQRTRAARDFRNSKTAVLFSSDVTARGMDFPNVTHVIQLGVPSSRESYIHRLGRTARAGKVGEGYLFVSPIDARERQRRISGLPLQKDTSLQTAAVDMSKPADLPAQVAETLNQIGTAVGAVHPGDKAAVYKSQLGVFGWYPSKQTVVDSMNRLARHGWGLAEPPKINPALVQKLGMSRLHGLNVGHERSYDDSSRYGRERDRSSGRSERGSSEGGLRDRWFGSSQRGSPSSSSGYGRSSSGYGRSSRDGYHPRGGSRSGGYGSDDYGDSHRSRRSDRY